MAIKKDNKMKIIFFVILAYFFRHHYFWASVLDLPFWIIRTAFFLAYKKILMLLQSDVKGIFDVSSLDVSADLMVEITVFAVTLGVIFLLVRRSSKSTKYFNILTVILSLLPIFKIADYITYSKFWIEKPFYKTIIEERENASYKIDILKFIFNYSAYESSDKRVYFDWKGVENTQYGIIYSVEEINALHNYNNKRYVPYTDYCPYQHTKLADNFYFRRSLCNEYLNIKSRMM